MENRQYGNTFIRDFICMYHARMRNVGRLERVQSGSYGNMIFLRILPECIDRRLLSKNTKQTVRLSDLSMENNLDESEMKR